MNKVLAGLLLAGALVLSMYNWFPTEARIADDELLRVEAISAQIDDEFLPVDVHQAAVDDEQLLPIDTRTAQVDDEQVLPVEAQFA